MRIAYFTNRYPAVSHTFIRREIEAIEARGVKVDRIALRADPIDKLVDGDDRREHAATDQLLAGSKISLALKVLREVAGRPLRALGVLAFALGLGRRSGLAAPKMVAYWAEALLLRARTAACGADLVRTHFGTNGAVVARLARRLGGAPYAIAYHGPDEFDAPERWDIGGTVAEAAFVTAISHFCAAQIMRWSNPADWPRIHEVPCIVDADLFTVTPMPPGPLRLCTVARIAPQKGLPLLIDAIARLSDPPMLDIVGDGPGRAALAAQVARLGLADRVRFLGPQDGAGVRAALAGAHAFILPSFAEGLPVVIMEALASGRPVIASAIAATGELVDAGAGWLVAAGDIDGIAAAITQAAASDPDRLAEMGRHGRDRVRARHSAALAAARLIAACTDRTKEAAPCAG